MVDLPFNSATGGLPPALDHRLSDLLELALLVRLQVAPKIHLACSDHRTRRLLDRGAEGKAYS